MTLRELAEQAASGVILTQEEGVRLAQAYVDCSNSEQSLILAVHDWQKLCIRLVDEQVNMTNNVSRLIELLKSKHG